ncbi:MAG: DUF131 domain-containing protein [Sulfolobaceae archaeon]
MKLITLGIVLTLLGFLLIILSSISLIQISSSGSNIQYGGVILIGPLPIFFGNIPNGDISSLITFGIVLTIISILLYIISILLIRGRQQQRW